MAFCTWLSRIALVAVCAICPPAVAQSYTFTTFVGKGSGLSGPAGIAIDEQENLYIADSGNHTIAKVTPGGRVSIFAGAAGVPGHVDGPARSARFREPYGVTLDSVGNLYIADSYNHAVRRISPAGLVTTIATFPDVAMPPNGVIFSSLPVGIAVDRAGNLFVVDDGHYVIRRITPSGESTIYAGSPVITAGGVDGAGATARFLTPKGCVLDPSGNLYVADEGNYSIRKISPDQQVTTVAGHLSTSEGDGYFPSFHRGYVDGIGPEVRLFAPLDVARDRNGFLYVTDWTRIRRISPAGFVTTIAGGDHAYTSRGAPLPPVSADGTGGNALFYGLRGIAVGPSGAIYVPEGPVIRKGVPSPETPASRLVNVSVRGNVEAAAGGLIIGFVTSDIFAKRMVVRAIGPSLTNFGVRDALPAVTLRLNAADGAQFSANSRWAGDPTLAAAFARVGAFPLPVSSADAALAQMVPGGLHTVQLTSGDNSAGVALAEVYDDDPDAPTTRLVNISARARVSGTGQDLTAGFVIRGTESKTVLVRGIGPTLTTFGVPDALQNPTVTIYDPTGAPLRTNTRWNGDTALAEAFARVGAFSLARDSADCAILLTLPPGAYTAQVRAPAGTGGIALIEVYEMPAAK